MTERTVEVVLEVPLFEAFLVENVQAFEFVNFLGAEDGFETDDACERQYTYGVDHRASRQ
jgi:hypothetical protein